MSCREALERESSDYPPPATTTQEIHSGKIGSDPWASVFASLRRGSWLKQQAGLRTTRSGTATDPGATVPRPHHRPFASSRRSGEGQGGSNIWRKIITGKWSVLGNAPISQSSFSTRQNGAFTQCFQDAFNFSHKPLITFTRTIWLAFCNAAF